MPSSQIPLLGPSDCNYHHAQSPVLQLTTPDFPWVSILPFRCLAPGWQTNIFVKERIYTHTCTQICTHTYVCIIYTYKYTHTILHTVTYLFHFLLWIQVTVWCHFLPAWRSSFSISSTTCLSTTNSPSFYLGLAFFQFWKRVSLDIKFWMDSYFSLSFSCLLDSIVLDEKSTMHCIDISLYVMSHFFLAAFSIFPLFLSSISCTMMA